MINEDEKEVNVLDESNNSITQWDELDISPHLLRGIYSHGYEKPSPIQQRAILPMLQGRDVVAQAQSGTGKTAAFVIGALSKVDLLSNKTQVLILSPTKELSIQTADVVSKIGSMMTDLRIETAFGGGPAKTNNPFMSSSETQPHIICGCPGKILDMLGKRIIQSSYLKLVVIDEVDEMLSEGFNKQIYDIFQYLDENVQIALFSATLPPSASTIISKIVRNPVQILVKSEMLTLEGIQQFFVAVQDDDQKYEALKHIFSFLSVSQCIIYCNSVHRVEDLYAAMTADNFPVACIHRNMSKEDRESAFTEFKSGKSRVLISTNVTSRGIDIQQVSVVINFDIPTCVNNYLHRIGRSGRWGRKGVGINFATRRDVDYLKRIEEHYVCNIKALPQDLSFINKC